MLSVSDLKINSQSSTLMDDVHINTDLQDFFSISLPRLR